MAESLLSFSEVLLFGRLLADLQIKVEGHKKGRTVRVATLHNLDLSEGISELDGVELKADDKVLVRRNKKNENGIYEVVSDGQGGFKLGNRETVDEGMRVAVSEGVELGGTTWLQLKKDQKQAFKKVKRRGSGKNQLLEQQLQQDARFARIYGFAYEGIYFELPEPTVFLVHGDGKSATDENAPPKQAARAPLDPSVTGVAAADYQIANEIRVWEYDKADYSIRMDVMTGMLEQILLDVYFGGGPDISGAKVSGAKVSGAKVSGAKVSGAKVSGAKVSGAKARGSGD
ncbi:MAG: hypothetical protein HWE35_16420 [Rhodobacteraceae bacterium]|nr:hypothetical protein [Paracoccaceae bacterium]